jgi:hypothetical protein
MYWIKIEELYICIDHLQMFNWRDGVLYLHILGRSVPEMLNDPDGDKLQFLATYLERKVAK